MPNIIKENISMIQQVLMILCGIIAVVWGIMVVELDGRYVEAEEVKGVVELVIAPHIASDKMHSTEELPRYEFDLYRASTSSILDSLDARQIRMDGKIDRLIEMQLSK